MRLYRPTWKAKDGERRRSSRWWLDFADGDGRRWRLPGLTDKRQTSALAGNVERLLAVRTSGDALPADLLKWLEQVPADFRLRLAEAGLIERERVGGISPLMTLDADGNVIGGHLAAFLADAKARGVSKTQLHMLAQRIRDVLSKAGTIWLRDLSAARVQAAIAALGQPSEERPKGLSKQSLSHYSKALRQFSRWLHRERRTAEDVLIGLKTYNAETDKRHERRGFTADEMAALLDFTAQAPARWGMSGPTRTAAYRLAFASGLRRNEIRTLTRTSFDLDAVPPTVTVEAGYSKHRRQDVQPLPADVAEVLARFLADADAAKPFPLPDKTGRMLHQDMAEARQAWLRDSADAEQCYHRFGSDFLLPRDSRGLVLDFHSFRHGYVTAICRANVSPRVMMELARHSDPRLTMKRYSRVAVSDAAAALDCLPKLTGANGKDSQTVPVRMTGTYDATAAQDAPGCPRTGASARAEAKHPSGEADAKRFAKSFAKPGGLSRTSANLGEREAESKASEKPLRTKGEPAIIAGKMQQAPVAQLDSASVFGTEGCRFESCRACFISRGAQTLPSARARQI